MKSIIIVIAFISIVAFETASAQSFLPIQSGFNSEVTTLFYDTTDAALYAGGSFWKTGDGDTMWHISRWNGIEWDPLGQGLDGTVFTISKFQGELYAGGIFSSDFDSVGSLAGLAKWNGIDWISVNNDTTNTCCVLTSYVNGNEIYFGGTFTSINGQLSTGIARFDGVNWFYYPPLISSFYYISAIIIYNNELYIGGNFDCGIGLKDIMKFDGTNWVSVGGGLSGGLTWVHDFEIYQNKLYVSGNFKTNLGDPGNSIAFWDGQNWNQPGSGAMNSDVFKLHVFNNQLFMGGTFSMVSGLPIPFLAKWDGLAWSSLNGTFDNFVRSMESFNTELYIGGGFWTISGDTMNHITKYTLPVGIEENESIENESIIQISPNPATNFIDIQSNHGFIDNIQLFDISGKIVLEQKDDEILNCRIDVSSIANGIYFLKVFSDNSVYVEKLMIQKL